MLTQFENKIAEIGLDLSETKLQWATNVEQAKDRTLTCKAGSFKATDKIDCLGTVVAINTMMFAEVDKRIAKGWAQYFSLKTLLEDRRATIEGRLELAQVTVMAAMMWGLDAAHTQ